MTTDALARRLRDLAAAGDCAGGAGVAVRLCALARGSDAVVRVSCSGAGGGMLELHPCGRVTKVEAAPRGLSVRRQCKLTLA